MTNPGLWFTYLWGFLLSFLTIQNIFHIYILILFSLPATFPLSFPPPYPPNFRFSFSLFLYPCLSFSHILSKTTNVPSRHKGTEAHMTSQRRCSTHETCTGSSQMESQHWQEQYTGGPTPNQESICNWYLMARGKSVFSRGMCPWVYQPHSRVGLMSRSSDQNKTDYIFVWLVCFGGFFSLGYFLYKGELLLSGDRPSTRALLSILPSLFFYSKQRTQQQKVWQDPTGLIL